MDHEQLTRGRNIHGVSTQGCAFAGVHNDAKAYFHPSPIYRAALGSLGAAWAPIVQAAETRPIDGIADNSFFIEEAYNQEPGVAQHIFTGLYGEERDNNPRRRSWAFGFTQEWPLFSQRHQFSYTIPFSFTREGRDHQDGVEDIVLNYRLQALEESEGAAPGFCPPV